MGKHTISISDEVDDWYQSQLISLSKFVQKALEDAMNIDKQLKMELKKQYPTLAEKNQIRP